MQNQTLKGIALMTVSSVLFAAMAGLIRSAQGVSSYQAAFIRFAVGIALLGAAALWGRAPLKFVNKRILLVRGLAGGVSVFLFYLSISRIGITKGVVINYTHSVFATLMGIGLLKERVGKLKWAAIGLCMAGIFLLTFKENGWATGIGRYEFLGLIGALSAGFAVVMVKKARETDSSPAIYFSQCLVGFWIMVLPASFVPGEFSQWAGTLLIGAGFLATGGQLLMTQAYGYVPISTGALTSMLVPVFSGLIGIFFFREDLTLRALTGAGLVMVSCGAVIWLESRERG